MRTVIAIGYNKDGIAALYCGPDMDEARRAAEKATKFDQVLICKNPEGQRVDPKALAAQAEALVEREKRIAQIAAKESQPAPEEPAEEEADDLEAEKETAPAKKRGRPKKL